MKRSKMVVFLLIIVGMITLIGCKDAKENKKEKENIKIDQSVESKGNKVEEKGVEEIEGAPEESKEKAAKAIRLYINENFNENGYTISSYNDVRQGSSKAIAFKSKSKNGYFVTFDKDNNKVQTLETMGQNVEGTRGKYSKEQLKNIAIKAFEKVKCFNGKKYEVSDNKDGTDFRKTGFTFNVDGKSVLFINVERKTGKIHSMGFNDFNSNKSLV